MIKALRLSGKLCLYLMLILASYSTVKGTHIMGVDITYECVGPCTYRVNWRAYRDCGGVTGISPNINFNVIAGVNCPQPVAVSAWTAQQTTEVTPICPGISTRCTDPNATINGVQEYYRYRDFDICTPGCTYQITWYDCCRNNAITSGAASDGIFTGSTTINTGITPCNSSPQFTNPPIPYICAGQAFTFNQGAYDLDGDSLVYSLGPCYDNSGVNQVGYNGGAGYSPVSPLGNSWNVNIDPNTGDISVIPNPGNMVVGVLCIYVEEYRNGQLIGTVVRDMQITVINCGPNTAPSTNGVANVTGGTGNGFIVNTCLGSNLCFDIPVIDPDAGQTVTFWWNQNIPGATFTETNGNQTDTIVGANPSATFCWTPVNPGTYTFLVSMQDDNCPLLASNQFTFQIIVNPGFTVTSSSQVNCQTASFSAQITGGTAPFTYVWTGPGGLNATGANPSHQYPAPGNYNYSLTVTDANGCTGVSTGTVVIPQGITLTTQQVNVSCNGGSNASATVAVANGTAPFTYSWSNGGTSNSVSGLSAGAYTVQVTDANGCTATANLTITEPLVLAATIAFISPLCNGGSNGTATVVASGGTAPYSYQWSNGQTTATASGLSSGSWTVVVTDANSCTVSQNTSITQPAAVTVSVTSQNATCFGGNNGSANANASGGNAPYTYSWSNGQTGAQLSGVSAGSYTVVVTDANGCTGSGLATIGQSNQLQLSINSNDPSCNGSSNGSAGVQVSGGVGPYTYAWSSGQTGATATGLSAGNYNLQVTDANGCTASAGFTLSNPPALTLNMSSQDVSCNNGSNGSATVAVSGGNAPYTYAWSNGGNGSSISNLAAGAYTLQVTDANGCIANANLNITEPAALTANLTFVSPLCNGNTNGSAAAIASGGTAPYSYQWSNGQTTATANGLSAGNWTLVLTDANGCSVSQSVNLTQPAVISLNVTTQNATCFGGNNGSANASASGGSAPYTYAWSNGQTGTQLSGVSAGSYTLVVTDANGCTASNPVTISQSSQLQLTISSNNPSCNGSLNGSAGAQVSGGMGPYTYAWSSGQTGANATGLAAGNYSLQVTDVNGCTASAGFSLSNPPALTLSMSSQDVACNSGSTGSASVTANGGTPPYTYAWSNGGSGISISNLAAGAYTVQVTDANGCNSSQSVQIGQPASVLISINVQDVRCFGDANGSANAQVSGGTAPYTYNWSNGSSNANLSNLSAGSLTLQVTDANGCSASAVANISQPQAITLSMGSTDTRCHGSNDGTALVSPTGGTAPYSFAWSNGQTLAQANGLGAGSWTVVVTDANGCSQQGQVSIAEPDPIQAISQVKNVSCAGLTDGSINIAISGGTSPYQVLWSNGQTGVTLNNLPPGVYQAQITDANGCTHSIQAGVEEPAPLAVQIRGNASVCLGGSGALEAQVAEGTAPYTLSWTSSPGNFISSSYQASISPTTNTIYTLVVTDANGCETTADWQVNVLPLPEADFEVSDTKACDSLTVSFVNLSTGATSWFWDFGDGNSSTAQHPVHSYGTGTFDVTLIAYSSDGCSDTLFKKGLIRVLPTPIAAFTTQENLSDPILLENALIHFQNRSQYANSYFWEFGDGAVSTETHPVHRYEEAGEYPVTLYAYNEYGCYDSLTISPILIIPNGVIFVPNAFTPNGDGTNEEFLLKGEGITDYELVIYDRWGSEIFRSQSILNSWDGQYKGQPAQEGVYVWKLVVSLNNGTKRDRGGTLTLIR